MTRTLVRSLAACAVILLIAGIWTLGIGAPNQPTAPATLELKKGDHIAIVGSGFAEYLQHEGWLETLIQSRFPDRELVIRNLAHAGDELTVQIRVDGFGSQDEWLRRVSADVVFGFWGFNESFQGPDGLDKFRRDLANFITHTQGQNFSGKANARVVLISPIAFQDIDPENIRGADEVNANLTLYTKAMAEVAQAHNVPFIDLFALSQQLYAASDTPLTFNGVHPNAAGCRAFAETLDTALFGPRRRPVDDARIRPAVLDKNFHWFQHYRHTDGYNIYGGRSALRFGHLTNFDVMMREMEILAAMAARRDRVIWAAANGKTILPDDTNLPEHIDVPTNKPGSLPGGKHLYISGEEGIAKMDVHEDLRVELFASEEEFPELINPVQIAFDTKGRLWVASWKDYTSWQAGTPLNDKLIIYEDTDNDGKADKRTIFADNLYDPTGFEFWNGGVLISQAPYIVFLKDTDGDDVADVSIKLLSHISSGDSHHTANSFVMHGGWLYFNEGVFHRTALETPYGPVRNIDAAGWRFNPLTFQAERYISYGFANPHGHVVDRWGRHIVHDGTGAVPFHASLFSGHLDGAGAKHPAPPRIYSQRTRPCPATEILSSRHFPDEMQDNLLVGNVIGFLGILHYRLNEDGASFRGTEVPHIVRSDDPNFRPVDFEIAPDGSLYMADWHNAIIGHMQHHVRDPSRDHIHGRIYRITHKTRPLLDPVPLAGEPIAGVLDALKTPENRVRYRAHLELSSRDRDEVVAELGKWVDGLSKADANYEHHLLEALWVYQANNVVNEALLKQLLRAKHPLIRGAATSVLCDWRRDIPEALSLLAVQAEDEHPAVRMEAVRAASFFREGQAADVALRVLKRPMDDYLEYVLRETMRQLEPYWKEAIRAGEPIAHDNPAGVDFLLDRVSDAELLKLPPTLAVYQARLLRTGVPMEARQEALAAIAKANNSEPAVELIKAIEHADRTGAAATVVQLASMLTQASSPAALKPVRPHLEALAREGRQPATREVAFASLITVDGSVDAAWKIASQSTALLFNFANATPLVSNEKARAAMYPRLVELVAGVPAHLQSRQRDADGLKIEYFNTSPSNATVEAFRELTPAASGVASSIDLESPLITNRNRFSLRFSGSIDIPRDGVYRFYTRSDDGSRLYIDGKLVVNNDGNHGSVEREGEVQLGEGPHEIVVTYFNSGGGHELAVFWRPPGSRKRAIPADRFVGISAQAVQDAAIAALAQFPERSAQTFAALAPIVIKGEHSDSAIAALGALDASKWPADKLAPVLNALIGQLKAAPALKRADESPRAIADLAKRIVEVMPADRATMYQTELDELKVVTIYIRPVREQMIYDRKDIYVERGKPVELIFENVDNMPHNLVIVERGAQAKVGLAAETMALEPDAASRHYIPDLPQVMHHTRLLMPGETQRIVFLAPDTAGEWPFLCTYPGHWSVMKGTMHVVDSVDMQMAQHEPLAVEEVATPPAGTPHNWTIAELLPDLHHVSHGRSFERGKEVFSAAGCINCHKMGDDGKGVGPDLTLVRERLKLEEIVREIIEPSSVINPEFEGWVIETHDYDTFIGVIVKEDDNQVHLANSAEVLVIDKSNIAARSKNALSIMPSGVLIQFQKKDILDLLAYLQAGGNANHAIYKGHP